MAVLAVALGACSPYEYVTDKLSAPVVLKCPDYWVVSEAASLVRFRDGAGRDLTDVNYEGEIVGVQLSCTSNIDRKTRIGTMDIEVRVRFDAARGPTNRDRKARFDYFVRVLNPNKKILMGKDLSVVVNFPGNQTRLQFRTPPLIFEVPITSKWPRSYYRIFAGFKLTREELDFNRKKIREASPKKG